MSAITDNDQIIGLALFEIYRRQERAGCDGVQVNADQALCFASHLTQLALPHLPNSFAFSLILSQLDQIIPVTRLGAPSYQLWLGWSLERYLWLWLHQIVVSEAQLPLLQALGQRAGAKVFRNEDGLRYVWEPK